MRWLCRIGIHDWSKWSRTWYQHTTSGWWEARRTIRCQCCGWEKEKEGRRYQAEAMRPLAPFWED